jgi:hypothetical protein
MIRKRGIAGNSIGAHHCMGCCCCLAGEFARKRKTRRPKCVRARGGEVLLQCWYVVYSRTVLKSVFEIIGITKSINKIASGIMSLYDYKYCKYTRMQT